MLRCVSQRNRLRGFTGLNSTCSDINIAVPARRHGESLYHGYKYTRYRPIFERFFSSYQRRHGQVTDTPWSSGSRYIQGLSL